MPGERRERRRATREELGRKVPLSRDFGLKRSPQFELANAGTEKRNWVQSLLRFATASKRLRPIETRNGAVKRSLNRFDRFDRPRYSREDP